MFFALRNHFTKESYDYFLYNGKVSASKDSFLNHRDKFKYQRLSRLVSESEMKDFLVANILAGKKWVGEFLDDNAEDIYRQYLKRNQSLTYMFSNELDKLFDKVDDVNDLFRVKDNEYPVILNAYLGNEVSIETMVILNRFIGFFDKFDEKLKDDYIWEKNRLLLRKYEPFVHFDKEKIKSVLKQKVLDKSK